MEKSTGYLVPFYVNKFPIFLTFILSSNLTNVMKLLSWKYQVLILGRINYIFTYKFFLLILLFNSYENLMNSSIPLALISLLVKLRSVSPTPGVFWRLTKIIYVKSSIIEPFLHSFIQMSIYWVLFMVVALLSFKDMKAETNMGLALIGLQSNSEYQH